VALSQAVLFHGVDITLVWRPMVAMFIIGIVDFAVAHARFGASFSAVAAIGGAAGRSAGLTSR